nr:conserved hypothetical protein [uncultured Gammaproteobacteria bacterium]
MKTSILQSILLDTDGTVTDIIRHITGDTIRVTKIEQRLVYDNEPRLLQLDEESRLLHRTILLSGRKHYLYAESVFVMDRMSEFMRTQLLESQVPIGQLWQQERMESFREIIERGSERNHSLLEYFPDLETDIFLYRTYLVYKGGEPLGLITEKFPTEYFRQD